MARKIANYTVSQEGRDHGKLFHLTEMSASQGEWWATQAMLGLMRSNVEVPENFLDLGMAGFAELGLKKFSMIEPGVAKPLIDELMGCIQVIPDPSKPHVIRPLIETDIEEIATRVLLKWEVLKLHVDFSQAADLSDSLQELVKAAKPTRVTKISRKR